MKARRWAGVLVGAVASAGAIACAPPDATPERRAPVEVAAAHPAPPAHGPARFAFGAPADPARIASWDIDVRPDGAGLPPGRGSVAEGGAVFRGRCAPCHGATGTEGPYDVLVGGPAWGDADPPRPRTIGNYWPYATTLFDYVRRAMPQTEPGSLDADETYAVVAWLLARNGVLPDDAVLDAASLPEVVLPARDRFRPDDRRGGPEVR